MRFLGNPILLPLIPEPERWTDPAAERLHAEAMRRQRDKRGTTIIHADSVWCRRIVPETLTGDLAKTYGAGPHWHTQAIQFPRPLHGEDAQQFCRRVLNSLDALGLEYDPRD